MHAVADGLPDILPDLRRWALRLTRNPEDAADLVQDTCERALRAADRFTPGTSLQTWAFQIMRNHYIDGGRRLRTALAYVADRSARAPVHASGGQEAAVMLRECLSAAGRKCDLPLMAMDAVGYTIEEMSAARAMPHGTIKSRLARGRRALRKAMHEPAAAAAAPILSDKTCPRGHRKEWKYGRRVCRACTQASLRRTAERRIAEAA